MKITYMAGKDDVILRRYKRKIVRLVPGTRTDHGKQWNYVGSPRFGRGY
jgi:hypothetical protein